MEGRVCAGGADFQWTTSHFLFHSNVNINMGYRGSSISKGRKSAVSGKNPTCFALGREYRLFLLRKRKLIDDLESDFGANQKHGQHPDVWFRCQSNV